MYKKARTQTEIFGFNLSKNMINYHFSSYYFLQMHLCIISSQTFLFIINCKLSALISHSVNTLTVQPVLNELQEIIHCI